MQSSHYGMGLGRPCRFGHTVIRARVLLQTLRKPYPWTETALETATELIEEEETLDPVQRDNLVSSLPDLIAETPKTQVAVVRVKKFLTSAGKFTADAIRQFVIDFGCELAKQQLGI